MGHMMINLIIDITRPREPLVEIDNNGQWRRIRMPTQIGGSRPIWNISFCQPDGAGGMMAFEPNETDTFELVAQNRNKDGVALYGMIDPVLENNAFRGIVSLDNYDLLAALKDYRGVNTTVEAWLRDATGGVRYHWMWDVEIERGIATIPPRPYVVAPTDATVGHIAQFAANGQIKDSGVAVVDIETAGSAAAAVAAHDADPDAHATLARKADLGTAAAEDVEAFATASQGALAATALQRTGHRYVIVNDAGSDTDRGAALLAAYAAATTPTDGTRMVLLLPPGIYDLGTTGLHLTKARVDIEGLSSDRRATVITAAITTPYDEFYHPVAGTITQSVGDVRIANLTVRNTGMASDVRQYHNTDPAAYFQVVGDADATIVRNVAFEVTADDGDHPWTMRIYAALNGRFEDVRGGDYAFNNIGGTLTATNCTGGNGALSNVGGTLTATNCTGGDMAFFNSDGALTATSCTGGYGAFYNSTGMMTATNCVGGDWAFFNASGTLTVTGCVGGDWAFINETGTLTATNCTGGYASYTSYGGTLIARFCRLTAGTFSSGSTLRMCIDGSNNVVNQDP